MSKVTPDTVSSTEAPPYFDVLFARIQENDPSTLAAFGRHLHWGYWDDPALADGSPEDYAVAAERLCQLVVDAAPIKDGMQVLDVGCGFGGTIASINERFSNLDLTGVNIDERQLQRARTEVHSLNGNQLRFIQGDACALPFGPDEFDAVLAVECIFHFGDRRKFFEQVQRVLRPGGVLSICDFIPPAHVLPYLSKSASDPLYDESTRKTYGRIDLSYSTDTYKQLGLDTGLHLASDFDMTPNTQPTYPFLRAHMKAWDDPRLGQHFDKATAMLETASRKGIIQYKILTFRKQ